MVPWNTEYCSSNCFVVKRLWDSDSIFGGMSKFTRAHKTTARGDRGKINRYRRNTWESMSLLFLLYLWFHLTGIFAPVFFLISPEKHFRIFCINCWDSLTHFKGTWYTWQSSVNYYKGDNFCDFLCCSSFSWVDGFIHGIYSRLSLSRMPRDSLKHFEIFLPWNIRVAEVRKTINRTTTFNKWICNLTPEVRDNLKIFWKRGEIAP